MEYEKKKAIVTSYGWRFDVFSWFPNVVDIQIAQADSTTWSFWRWAGFSVWGLLLLALGFVTYRLTPIKNKGLEDNI